MGRTKADAEKEARRRDHQAEEAQRFLREQLCLEAERQKIFDEQQRLERARQEEACLHLAAAQAIAKQAASSAHADMLANKNKAEAEARLAEERLKEWKETFCVGRWVQITAKGAHQNKFALVFARPSLDGALKIRLFVENVSAC